jgi:hypothetical protein
MARSLFSPDLDQAEAYLAALDPDPAAQFGFRTFADYGDDPRLAILMHGSLYEGRRQSRNPEKNGTPCRPSRLLEYMQRLGAGVFVAVNEMDGIWQADRNVVRVRPAIADADSASQVASLKNFIARSKLQPTIMIASGGLDGEVEKLQAYWRVVGCPVSSFTRLQKIVISRTSTDPSIINPSRVLRLAGFNHQKREPRLTRIVSLDASVQYPFEEFIARTRAQPQVYDPWARGDPRRGRSGAGRERITETGSTTGGTTTRLRVLLDASGGLITPAVHRLLREAVPPTDRASGNRHSTLVSAVARCTQARWQAEEMRELILPVVDAEWEDGDWREHLDRIIAWTLHQQAAAIAATPATPAAIVRAFGAD